MNVYVFRTTKFWGYCGGGVVVIADSFKRAGELVNRHISAEEKREFPALRAEKHTFLANEPLHKPDDFINLWILVEEIPTTLNTERVVLAEWNYA